MIYLSYKHRAITMSSQNQIRSNIRELNDYSAKRVTVSEDFTDRTMRRMLELEANATGWQNRTSHITMILFLLLFNISTGILIGLQAGSGQIEFPGVKKSSDLKKFKDSHFLDNDITNLILFPGLN